MENSKESKTRMYTKFTKKQTSELRKALKLDEPRLVTAKRFANEWNKPASSVYRKLNVLSRTKRKYTKRTPKVNTVVNVTKTDEGVTLTGDMVNVLGMLKKPTKVVMYNDHVRYYYN